VEFPKAELETLWAPWRFEYFEKSGTPDFLSEAAGPAMMRPILSWCAGRIRF